MVVKAAGAVSAVITMQFKINELNDARGWLMYGIVVDSLAEKKKKKQRFVNSDSILMMPSTGIDFG